MERRLKNRILAFFAIGLLPIVLSIIRADADADAYNGCAESKDGTVLVSFNVEDGYKISLRIDTSMRKNAYSMYFQADVANIQVEFIDVNNDSFQDVMIQYADETGYSPEILINRRNVSFVSALPKLEGGLYVDTELEITDKGKAIRAKDYELRDITGDGIPELFFFKVFIGKNGYRYVAFLYDGRSMNYQLFKKGELFGPKRP